MATVGNDQFNSRYRETEGNSHQQLLVAARQLELAGEAYQPFSDWAKT